MRNLGSSGLIILAAILIAFWAVYPPSDTLRLGKDLAGGATLVYGVDVKPGETDVIGRVVEVIKERIDPNGVLEISVVAVGADRIEITMPLPTQQVKDIRAKVEEALKPFATSSISSEEIDRIMAAPAETRTAQIAQIAKGDTARSDALTLAAATYDQLREARQKLTEAQAGVDSLRKLIDDHLAAGGDPADPQFVQWQAALPLAQQAVAAQINIAAPLEIAYEDQRTRATAGTITASDVRRALSLSDREVRLRGKDKEVVTLESPRARALQEIRAQATDDQTRAAVDNVVAIWNEYEAKRRTLDDPADLIRLLKGAGVLSFRITINPGEYADEQEARNQIRIGGPTRYRSPDARWFKINKIENWIENAEQLETVKDPASAAAFFANMGYVVESYRGEFYMLAWDRRGLRLTVDDGAWAVSQAFQDADSFGRPAIAFRMDPLGGSKLGSLTEKNVNKQMAVLLDDEVYTAPRLISRIADSGQITGNFSQAELSYIIRVLSAGSLAAKLTPEPISQNTLGPQLGKDNLDRGLKAGLISLAITAGFMVVYYFGFGMVAVLALLINSLLILGAMALNQAAFTLPGIAGVILTFGMAVDANVLVYERVREELLKGEDLRTSVRLGYERALSAIVDGNVTTLIVCVVLGFTGTPEIKGFALTLGIGLVTTLFSQLFVTRWIFTILVEKVRIRRLSMLPMAVPAVQKLFDLHVDWMRLRGFFYALSFFFVGLGILFIVVEGRNLLASEFRGGTSVTIVTKSDGAQPVLLKRSDVADRVKAIADEAPAESPLKEFATAEIAVVNPRGDGVSSDTFTIKTLLTNAETVQTAIISAFSDVLDVRVPVTFKGSDGNAAPGRGAPVYTLVGGSLDEAIDMPGIAQRIPPEFVGGVGIVLADIQPPLAREEIESRLSQARSRTDFADTSGRDQRVIVLQGPESAATTVVILVQDSQIDHFEDEARWNDQVRDREWELARAAFTEAQTLASVQSFGSAIAATFRAQAITALLISSLLVIVYIWVRFGSLRYAFAAMATTAHDCFVSIGMVGAAAWIYHEYPDLATSLKLLPFKIDLNVIAAILTILGYSLNDTVVVMDRVRENRGKLPYASRAVINASVNQTLSRTVITGGTTFVSCIVLYLIGGEGVRVFAFTMIVGIVVGTFSSIAVAAPLVWSREADPHADEPTDPLKV
jgi:SecD/SecF fusion protein